MKTWTIDTTHANVDFSVKHMAISTVRGAFNLFNGTGKTNEDGFPVSLAMEIDAASISTNNEQRDGHLKSPDFFDVANHPKLTFVSTRISGTRDDVTIVGDLTIRGVTKPVTLKGELGPVVKDPWGNERTALVATGKLSREQFGLVWNMALEFGGVMVSDEVKLHVEVEAVATVPVAA